MIKLRRDEDVYQDTHSGCWIAQYLKIDANGNERWVTLGTFGTRAFAMRAIQTSRMGT